MKNNNNNEKEEMEEGDEVKNGDDNYITNIKIIAIIMDLYFGIKILIMKIWN